MQTAPGAEAPKVSMLIETPSLPVYLLQPKLVPASTESRLVTALGNTDSRYSASCASNSSQQGIETTRTFLPSPRNCSAALTQSWVSLPVPIRIRSGVPSLSESI